MERKLLYHALAFQKLMNDILSARICCAPEAVETGSSEPGDRYFIKHKGWCLLLSCCCQDLDAYHDDEANVDDDRDHYYSAAPSGWDDPGNNEVPPPYMRTDSDPQDYHPGPNVNRGDSFVSPAMFVWADAEKTCVCVRV